MDGVLEEAMPGKCAVIASWARLAKPVDVASIAARPEGRALRGLPRAARRAGMRMQQLLTNAAPLALQCLLMRADPAALAATHAAACTGVLAREPDVVVSPSPQLTRRRALRCSPEIRTWLCR